MNLKLNKGIIPFCGSSGVGKGTFTKRLLEDYPDLFDLSVSATTRPKRTWEIEGKHYLFKNSNEFQQLNKEDELFEDVDKDSSQTGHLYATLKSEIVRINDLNKFILLDVDLHGLFKAKEVFGEQCLSFYIHTDFNNRNRWLIDRDREEEISVSDLNLRLERGKHQDEVAFTSSFKKRIDHYIYNKKDKFEDAYKEVLKNLFVFIEEEVEKRKNGVITEND